MIRKLICLLMIPCILFQSNIRLGWLAYYELHKEFITQHFCINKSRPSLHCDGKCYLAKKLKAQNEEEGRGRLAADFKAKFEQIGIFYPIDILSNLSFTRLKNPPFSSELLLRHIKVLYFFQYLTRVFHPPN